MRTIVLANMKGGVGKTLHAAHLSVELEAMGQGPVAIMDLDPQGTFAGWWNDRKEQTPVFAKVNDHSELAAKHKSLRDAGFKWLIIDTPPQTAVINRAAIQLADLVIIPCKHGKGDIQASLSTVDLCEAEHRKFIYLLNETNGVSVAEKTRKMLAGIGPVIPQHIPKLNGYWQAMFTGNTITELSKGTGALLVQDVAEFIVSKFEKPQVQEKAHA